MEQSNKENTIIIFAKTPESGTAKSRIAETHGNKKALEIYLELLQISAKSMAGLPYHVTFTGSSHSLSLKTIYTDAASFFKQTGENLGDRLQNAFNYLFNKGYKNICAIGTDCPCLTRQEIEDTFNHLGEGKDTVIGPTYDGGYYIIGCTKNGMDVFSASKWSTSELFKETMEIIEKHSLSCHILKKLHDIDYMEDYLTWKENI
jgi:rSAM/selenodomain-associated transferase 1